MTPLVSIITINYNGLKDTCELIESLPANDASLEVIVVDNASKGDDANVIARRFPWVKVVHSKQNLGFAGGNNLGIREASGRYLFFVNNDTVFPPSEQGSSAGTFCKPLIDRLESAENIGMVCPKIRFSWGSHPIQYTGYTPLSAVTLRNRSIGFGEDDNGQYDSPHETPYAHGAAMMAKRDAVNRVGLMPECYFLYYEELDWSMMFRRSGYTIWYEPACTIYHKESQATGQNSPLKTYYITRNRLLFVRRNNSALTRYASYIYLIGVVAVRDILKYTFQKRPDLVKATVRGISHFLKSKVS